MELSAIAGKLLSGASCTVYAAVMGAWAAIAAVATLQRVSEVVTQAS